MSKNLDFRLYIVTNPHKFGIRDDVDVFNPINQTGILSDDTRFIVVKPHIEEIKSKISGIWLQQDIMVENLFEITSEMINVIQIRIYHGSMRLELL